MLVKGNLSKINQEHWEEAKLKSNNYRNLDRYYYPCIAGYSKWSKKTFVSQLCYRILEMGKSIFGQSDRQKSLKRIENLVKIGDPRFAFYPANQAKKSAKVIFAFAVKQNNRERKYPNKKEEEVFSELTPWLKQQCADHNIKLGLLRNLGLNVLNFLVES